MPTDEFFYKNYFKYVSKFLLTFCIFYFGTIAIIGLSAPKGYYSPFIEHYLNYIDWVRTSLLFTSKEFLSLLGYKTYLYDKYDLLLEDGTGISMVYSCVGYGVMSFWAAFIVANKGTWGKKIQWLLAGLIAIWVINVFRISLLVIAINKKLSIPFFDHHTWFNIAAYLLIFILIYFYDRSSRTLKTL